MKFGRGRKQTELESAARELVLELLELKGKGGVENAPPSFGGDVSRQGAEEYSPMYFSARREGASDELRCGAELTSLSEREKRSFFEPQTAAALREKRGGGNDASAKWFGAGETGAASDSETLSTRRAGRLLSHGAAAGTAAGETMSANRYMRLYRKIGEEKADGGESAGAGQIDASLTLTAERLSQAVRRDARRYDGAFKKY